MTYKVGIIGLGRIASTFDNDPLRKIPWSHAGAYTSIAETEIAAAADIDCEKRDVFKEKWGVKRLYENYEEMLKKEDLDIVSICTHEKLHSKIAVKAAEAGVKAIFCEKPMATSVKETEIMLESCKKNNVKLVVDHYKRREEIFKKAKEVLDSGEIGELKTIIGYYSNELMNVGTHLFDILRFYAGPVDWITASLRESGNVKDPGGGGFILFKNGVHGHVVEKGGKNYLIFEIDLLCTNGRLRVLENGRKMEIWSVKESEQYSECKELVLKETIEKKEEKSWMIDAVKDVVNCIEKNQNSEIASGEEGKAALELAIAFHESEKNGNAKVSLPLNNINLGLE